MAKRFFCDDRRQGEIVLLRFKVLIGIDIGGTKIRAILWNGKRVVRAREFPTPKNETEFREALRHLAASWDRKSSTRGIGIGVAGIVERSVLRFSPNIPYIKNFDFRELLSGLSLRVDNDARCFLRAELFRGAGRRAESLFALTIGTGIGRAYAKNGKILALRAFEYPEPWEKRYQILRDRRDDQKLARFLACRLAALVNPYNPERIVIGGGVMKRKSFLEELRAALQREGCDSEVRGARFGKNAVALGAALLFAR